MPKLHRLSDALSVAPQIDPGELADLARDGFRVLIDNRPDAEVGAAESSAAMAAAAEVAGMAFRYIPFTPGVVTEDMVADFAAALDLPGPAVAYCRSGTRSSMLWALAIAGEQRPAEILDAAAAGGYDLSHLAPMLQARHARGG